MDKDINLKLLGQRIVSRRKELGVNQQDIGKRLGYTSKSAMSKLEHGAKKNITVSMLKTLADVLQTSPEYLAGWTDNPNYAYRGHEVLTSDTGSTNGRMLFVTDDKQNQSQTVLTPTPKTVQLPILGEVAAGIGEYADNNIIGYEDVPRSWVRGNDDYVLLRVHGDSMVPKFEENDLLLVRVQTSVDSGDYAIAIVDDENGVVKRVMYGKDWIELQSQNPMYAPRRFEGADVLRIRIFGLVKKSIRDY